MISSFYEKIVGGSPPPADPNEPKILCIGNPCLDIVHVCKHYPVEDSDERCQEYRWQRGGNACNNCTVLSKLGTPTEFLGILGTGHYNWDFLKDDMRKHEIDFSHCPVLEGVECPISTVILTANTGSRTILHYNSNSPDLKLEDLEKLDLKRYSWIHFEGRNVPRVLSMMQYLESYNNGIKNPENNPSDDGEKMEKMTITISVELEKKNIDLLDLLPYADVAFISRDFAESRGYSNMGETLKNMGRDVKSGAVIVCAWGDRGAMAKTPNGTIVQSPAFSPPEVVDTLGAGDTFTAATLHYLNMVKISRRKIQAARTSEISEQRTATEEASCAVPTNLASSLAEGRIKSELPHRRVTQNSNIESLEFSRTEFIDRRVLQGAVTFACRVAGSKVGSRGYDAVSRAPEDLLSSSVAR
ncbi:ketohexokinase-like isoform X2 [Venturia canescens]|nr:ketohexokinase-like isoform X2 [Venturia canescens]XP_043285437.1 ketohexokinase-like isoform X2 [Venturia canescens]